MTVEEFESHYAAHAKHLLTYLRYKFGVKDAEDIASSAWMNAWRSKDMFRSDCSFKTWITRIAINQGITERTRGHSGASHVYEVPLTPVMSRAVHATGDVERNMLACERLKRAMRKVNKEDADVMRMVYVYGFSMDEVAGMKKLKVSTLKVRMLRAYKKVRS
jgi:RNA polymerase sigma-70 factor (ECF subfamily)